MNFLLVRNLAEMQRRSDESNRRPLSDEEKLAVNGLINKIGRFKLGKRTDKHGDREAWFGCKDYTAFMDALGLTEVHKALIGDRSLQLRVRTEVEEGEGARSGDVFVGSGHPEQVAREHLMGFLAVPNPEGGFLSMDGSFAIVRPDSETFRDIEATVEHFLSE